MENRDATALVLSGPESGPTLYTSRWRALLPLIAATVGGIVAEVLKLLFRRERPDAHAGAYAFRSWRDHAVSTAGLSLPSSHALVAFAGSGDGARVGVRVSDESALVRVRAHLPPGCRPSISPIVDDL